MKHFHYAGRSQGRVRAKTQAAAPVAGAGEDVGSPKQAPRLRPAPTARDVLDQGWPAGVRITLPPRASAARMSCASRYSGTASPQTAARLRTAREREMYDELLLGKSMEEVANELPEDHIVGGWHFQAFMFGATILNALQMGLQVDWRDEPWDTVWEVCGNLFTAAFVLEMIVKLYLDWRAYLRDRWNWLDFGIAWMGVLDTWVLPNFDTGSSFPLKGLQSLRILRMVKLLRMRRELTALVGGLVGSLKSMMWIGILLLMVIYTFAIFSAQVIGTADYSETALSSASYFESLPSAMLTLFSICIVDGWGTIIWSLWRVQPFLVPAFVCFLVLTSFGLLNALIGVIVEQTTLATQAMKAATEAEERNQKMQDVQNLVDAVLNIDKNDDGTISEEEMKAAEHMPELKGVRDKIDLPPGFTLLDLHSMLDRDGDGQVDKYEFIGGMYRLIYCNDFQAHCLEQLALSQTRKAIAAVHQSIETVLEEAVERMRGEMKTLLLEHLCVTATEVSDVRKVCEKGLVMDARDVESATLCNPPRLKVRTVKKPRGSRSSSERRQRSRERCEAQRGRSEDPAKCKGLLKPQPPPLLGPAGKNSLSAGSTQDSESTAASKLEGGGNEALAVHRHWVSVAAQFCSEGSVEPAVGREGALSSPRRGEALAPPPELDADGVQAFLQLATL